MNLGMLNSTVVIVVACSLIFLFFLHTIWSVVDCANTDSFSKSTKTFWIVFMMTVCVLGGIIYSLSVTRSTVHRVATFLAIAAVCFGCTYLYLNNAQASPTPTQTTVATVAPHQQAAKQHSHHHAMMAVARSTDN